MSQTTTTPPPEGTLAAEFVSQLSQLHHDVDALGLTWPEVCRRAGVSRTVPQQWAQKIPKTIQLMSAMQEVVNARRKELHDRGELPEACRV